MAQLSAPPTYLSPPLRVCMIVLSVSNLITYNSTYIVLTLSLPRLGPPTHHRPTSTHPWELSATCLLTAGYDSGCSLRVSVFVCVCKCVPLFLFPSVPGMWRFVWHVSHTLCYQHLCDEHKHSLRGLGVVSQMVQCQGPWVWFRGWWVALIPCLPSPVTLLCQGAIFPHTG